MDNPEQTQAVSIWSRPISHALARWAGLVLFLGASWLYAASGLLAPVWAVGLLWVLWLVFLFFMIKTWRQRPWMTLATPVVAYLTWALIMLAGDLLLGWTA